MRLQSRELLYIVIALQLAELVVDIYPLLS